jgi:hypothetical protein
MKKNPLSQGVIANKLAGAGVVSQAMIKKRAHELALITGRSEPTDDDRAQARRELSGGSDLDRRQEAQESLPESERWNPVPGSQGREQLEPPSEDEDEEGLNESAQLVEEGVQEAEHDQMIQAEEAARSAQKHDRQNS